MFDKKIIQTYLSLAKDKVSNVRLQFARIGKRASKIIFHNGKYKSELHNLLITLKNDKDKDIQRLSKEAYQILKKSNILNIADEEFKEKREQDLIDSENKVVWKYMYKKKKQKN